MSMIKCKIKIKRGCYIIYHLSFFVHSYYVYFLFKFFMFLGSNIITSFPPFLFFLQTLPYNLITVFQIHGHFYANILSSM